MLFIIIFGTLLLPIENPMPEVKCTGQRGRTATGSALHETTFSTTSARRLTRIRVLIKQVSLFIL